MTSLVDKIVALHRSLRAAAVPHGFGGALALAWCTQRARGTIDVDRVAEILAEHLGPDDERITRLRHLAGRP